MAHYAFLDENNIVFQVIVGKDENEDGIDWEKHYGDFLGSTCKRTSYNTLGNRHSTGGVPFRKNYAGIGFIYDEENDAFYAPQPFASWTLNPDTFIWEPPIPMPIDGIARFWNEELLEWQEA
jgi:hypothetical protein